MTADIPRIMCCCIAYTACLTSEDFRIQYIIGIAMASHNKVVLDRRKEIQANGDAWIHININTTTGVLW